MRRDDRFVDDARRVALLTLQENHPFTRTSVISAIANVALGGELAPMEPDTEAT